MEITWFIMDWFLQVTRDSVSVVQHQWDAQGKLVAVCRDSYVVYASCFDRVGKWSGFAKSMRITINTMIFRHLCHLALDHWKGRTLLFFCFYVILGNSQQFSVILGNFQWFAKKTWKFLWGNSDSWWFCDSQKTLKFLWDNSWCFSVIHQKLKFLWGDSQWFAKISAISLGWFLAILGDSQKTLKFLWGNSWWFANHSEISLGKFLVILSHSWWFMKNSEISLGQFSGILGNSLWFVNHSEKFLGKFSVIQIKTKISLGNSWWFSLIHEPLWNFFGVILSDSPKYLKFL